MDKRNSYILILNLLKVGFTAFASMIIIVGAIAWVAFIADFFIDVGKYEPKTLFAPLAWASFLLAGITFISGSKFGEWFFRLFFNMRKPTMREEERINPLIDKIEKDYFSKFNEKLTIDYFIVDAAFLNGFAFGFSTIAIHRGALEELNDEELQALLAHEIGHIHFKDGGYNSIQFSLGAIGSSILKYPLKISGASMGAVGNAPKDNVGGSLIVSGLILILFAPITIAAIVALPLNWLSAKFSNMGLWHVEYRADQFAANMGYRDGLISFFEKMLPLDERNEHGFLSRYGFSHPPTAMRIDRVERLIAE